MQPVFSAARQGATAVCQHSQLLCPAQGTAWAGTEVCAENEQRSLCRSVELLSWHTVLSRLVCALRPSTTQHTRGSSPPWANRAASLSAALSRTVISAAPLRPLSKRSVQWTCSGAVESVFQHANEIRVLLSTLSLA